MRGTVLDPGGDRDRERLLAPHAALAAAGAARLLDHGAGALAGRAGALDGEEALLRAHPPVALAGAAGGGRRPRLGAAAAARLALGEGVDADRRLLALERLVDRDFEVVAQIAAAARRAGVTAPAAHRSEHLLEDVGEPAGKAEPAGASRPALLEGGVAELVVGGSLLIVLEDVVGLVDLLEFLFRRVVAGVSVGVVFHRQPAVGALQFVGAGGPLADAECLVKILLGHGWRTGSPCRARIVTPEPAGARG